VNDTLLVTGGSGYLGSHLARQARQTWRVVATYHSHTIGLPGCQMVPLDIRDRVAVDDLLLKLRPRAIVHTAADISSPSAMQTVIVEGTRHVAAGAAAVGARLVHLSTDVVFDGEQAPYAEGDPPQPVTSYGRAKAEAEQVVAELCPEAAIVRTSLIYGFDPPDPRTMWIVDSVRHRQPLTLFTDEVRCPVWVEQLAAALLELAAQDEGGVWHLAGPQPLTRYQFGERLVRAYGLPSRYPAQTSTPGDMPETAPGGVDPVTITPGLSRESGLVRPRNCTLDVRKAQARLRSPLWGVDEVLAHVGPQSVG